MNIQKISSLIKTEWLGNKIHYQEKINSTNTWAKLALENKAKRGEVFLADFQSEGHGQKNRTWQAPKAQSILVSFIDVPPENPGQSFHLSLIAGVGFLKGLLKLFDDIPFKLKWPNDIRVHFKKLGGILCEYDTMHQKVIIGVGLNINVDFSLVSEDLKHTATSLNHLIFKPLIREEILASCLNHYEETRNLYSTEKLSPIIEFWNHYNDIVGTEVGFKDNNNSFKGTVKGLNSEGFLEIISQGKIHTLLSGDALTLCS